MSDKTLPHIVAHCKAYGFIFPSSQIYAGLQAVYDYGPYGVLLKRNLQTFWWRTMTQLHHNIVGLDAAILMATPTWEASGHLDNFHDWMIENKETNKRFRVDHLIEDKIAMLVAQGDQATADKLSARLQALLTQEDAAGLTALIAEEQIVDTTAKHTDWSDVKRFSLMFATHAGAAERHAQKIYLRPETAQGVFVNFSNVQKTARMKIPFGIAQAGKAFRNEIVARQFIFRMREFEQMELQFFVPPGTSQGWFAHWREKRHGWYRLLGIPPEKISYHPHVKLAHYATAAGDLTYTFPFGVQEIEGIHARGDFDLSSHAKHSKKKISYFDPKRNTSYTPHVIETSAGLDRLVLMIITEGFTQTADRTYLKFPPPLAPIQAAILPLLKKEPLTTRARTIFQSLAVQFRLTYDDAGSIGKRYTRQDLIGTPYAITIDFETFEDGCVTVREIVTTHQTRIPIQGLAGYLAERVDMQHLLQKSLL